MGKWLIEIGYPGESNFNGILKLVHCIKTIEHKLLWGDISPILSFDWVQWPQPFAGILSLIFTVR
jgi:hypothetical protein